MMNLKLTTIPLKVLKTSNRFPFSFSRKSEALANSIHQFGLMNPLLVWESPDGMEVVDGSRRLKILGDQECFTIPVFVMDNLRREEAFMNGLEANRWVKSFNLIEKSNILCESFQLFSETEIYDEILQRLEIQSIHRAQELMRFSDLPEEIQNFIVEKNIPPHGALLWLNFPKKEVLAVYEFIKKFPLNQNKLSTILQWTSEIAARDNLESTELLARMTAQIKKDVMEHEKVEKLIGDLEGVRYPRYAQKKEEFKKRAEKLFLPSGTNIEPHPYFEEKGVELKARVASSADLKKLIASLQNSEWDGFFFR